MLTQEVTRYIREFVAPRVAPVLSLYLDVNPANPDNQGKAYLLRAREAIAATQTPPEVGKKVLEALERSLPQAKSRVVFAAEGWMEIYDLQVDLPLVQGAEARWGEPYLTPILYVLDEYDRVGVVYIDSEKWRMFEVYLGEIEELPGAFRAVATQEWNQLTQDGSGRRYTQGGIHRAAANTDRFERRLDAWTHRFYKRLAGLLEQTVNERSIQRLVLMGPKTDVELFKELLPRRLRERVMATLPSLPTPGAQAGEVLKLVQEVLEPLQRERENKLLDELAERGVAGLDQTLELLQQGGLHLLVAPWNPQGKVYRAPDGWVGGSMEGAVAHGAGRIEDVDLKQVLPELAAAYGTRLEFVRGPAEERLHKAFGGLAGLPRW
ncbi:VLRF1 family aeRF1-type release factor [Meiothermus cerbereus]|uniref:VLRF1 family aeRF1-type release factor n=1 Tax=Meiothermus cerbereus TaxID=65552 RepID=UPI003EECCCA9